MSYRDDLDASQARVTALEAELAEARARIDQLEGKPESQALVKVGEQALAASRTEHPGASKWLGAPTSIKLTRALAGEVPESAFAELIETIRRIVRNMGTVSVLPGSLAWSANSPGNGVGPFVDVYFAIRDGKTTIHIDEKLSNLAGGIFGGLGGGLGFGGMMAPISTIWIAPVLVPIAIPVWLGGVYAACRKLYRNRARARAGKMQTLLEELVEICERRIAEHADHREADSPETP